MVNEIIIGIAKALSCYSGYEVYTDTMEQNIKEPCFLVKCIKVARAGMLTDRFRIRGSFQVVFLAGTSNAINDMAETLPFDLRRITVTETRDNKQITHVLNGVNLDCNTDEKEHTLVFLVDYLWTSHLAGADPDLMLTVSTDTEVKAYGKI